LPEIIKTITIGMSMGQGLKLPKRKERAVCTKN
jgi:hypothetical protein